MADEPSFSNRHGFREIKEADITVRHEAPYELRGVLIDLAYECKFRPKSLRTLVCRVLRKRSDSNNWSEYPNIDVEIRRLIDDAEWYRVYDIVEAIVSEMNETPGSHDLELFERELNLYFIENGIGWKLKGGRLEARSPEAVERTIRLATTSLDQAGSRTLK